MSLCVCVCVWVWVNIRVSLCRQLVPRTNVHVNLIRTAGATRRVISKVSVTRTKDVKLTKDVKSSKTTGSDSSDSASKKLHTTIVKTIDSKKGELDVKYQVLFVNRTSA